MIDKKAMDRVRQRLDADVTSLPLSQLKEQAATARGELADLGLRPVRVEVVAEPIVASIGSEISVRVLLDPEEIGLRTDEIILAGLRLNDVTLEKPKLKGRLATRDANTKRIEVVLSGSMPRGAQTSPNPLQLSVSAEMENGSRLEGFRFFRRP
jgi:hypothetical protein